ncbi:hypothetical protein M9H77_30464 [Catharanthus roseus]|uniref:Uncharacterized protein n=1 Tax=Catharanthus roseus TaxID=4058 RepID=A0ACB9ZXC3_CATRO|nr:hypothetical protein M9H77_30464 [Catharanthus roseus]
MTFSLFSASSPYHHRCFPLNHSSHRATPQQRHHHHHHPATLLSQSHLQTPSSSTLLFSFFLFAASPLGTTECWPATIILLHLILSSPSLYLFPLTPLFATAAPLIPPSRILLLRFTPTLEAAPAALELPKSTPRHYNSAEPNITGKGD